MSVYDVGHLIKCKSSIHAVYRHVKGQ